MDKCLNCGMKLHEAENWDAHIEEGGKYYFYCDACGADLIAYWGEGDRVIIISDPKPGEPDLDRIYAEAHCRNHGQRIPGM